MKPNIVIVLIDALRPKNLSLFGYNKETDKNIKKIASESLFFSQHFSTSNSTYPSLTSLFTSQYPNTHGVIHQYPYMNKKEFEDLRKNKFWFPIYLKKLGYNTFSMTPLFLWLKKGFDYVKQMPKPGLYRKITDNKIIKKILLRFPNFLYSFLKKIIKRNPSSDFSKSKEIIDSALFKIKEAQKRQEPFFLFMHLEYTHFPYPRVKFQKTKGKIGKNEILKNIKTQSQKEYIKKRFEDINLDYLEQIKTKYDSAIKETDEQIGRLYSLLRKTKLWDNTIFILLADHGDSLGEHGIYFSHAGVYDETTHTPLIMHLPKIKPQKINELVQNIDIIPTILEYMGEKKLKSDGKSLIPLIKNGKPLRSKVLSFDGLCNDRKGIRTKNKKSIISKSGKCFLCGAEHGEEKEEYDLKKDPGELKNLYLKK
jgi:arylsulfatase A-like enzyme